MFDLVSSECREEINEKEEILVEKFHQFILIFQFHILFAAHFPASLHILHIRPEGRHKISMYTHMPSKELNSLCMHPVCVSEAREDPRGKSA